MTDPGQWPAGRSVTSISSFWKRGVGVIFTLQWVLLVPSLTRWKQHVALRRQRSTWHCFWMKRECFFTLQQALSSNDHPVMPEEVTAGCKVLMRACQPGDSAASLLPGKKNMLEKTLGCSTSFHNLPHQKFHLLKKSELEFQLPVQPVAKQITTLDDLLNIWVHV